MRFLGASLVFLGCMLLALDGRWNPRIADVPGPGSHGLHALEAGGFVLAALGVAMLWIGSRARR